MSSGAVRKAVLWRQGRAVDLAAKATRHEVGEQPARQAAERPARRTRSPEEALRSFREMLEGGDR